MISIFKKFKNILAETLFFGILIFIFCHLPCFAQTLISNTLVTNGQVNAIAVGSDGTRYIGGTFTVVGPNTGMGVPIDANGTPLSTYPKVAGTVFASTPDGSSGWYIGGDFTSVNGVTRNRLAHILSDGTLDANWNPNASSTVRAIAVSGSNVYVGGEFTTIGGITRNYLAAISNDGTLTSWNPNADNSVLAIAISGSNVYVGGDFTTIGGTARNRLAVIGTDGTLSSWDPDANSTVRAIAISGSNVYVGGDFTTIGGTARNRLAAIDTDGTLQSWNPNASTIVYAIAISGSTVYVGGFFTTIGGTTRNYLAAIGTDGTLASWNPNANNTTRTLAISGSTVYVGGDFTTIGGTTRNRLAAIGTDGGTGGTLTSWNPNASSIVYALAISGSNVYVGGIFTTIGGTTRNDLAAIGTDGTLTSWNPNASSIVYALAISGSTVYVGGAFTTIGGSTRNNLAAIGTDGTLTSWNPDVVGAPLGESGVRAIAISGSNVYVGGAFTTIGGSTRNNLAAIGTDGTLTSWNPNANNYVYAITISGSNVYVGGNFTTIGGTTRNKLAAIGTDGTLASWNPNADGGVSPTVNALAISGSTVYAGGDFTIIGGSTRNNLAALDNSTGTATSWNPNAGSTVSALAISGSRLITGGTFTTIGSNPQPSLAFYNLNANLSNPSVISATLNGSNINTGSTFTIMDGDTLSINFSSSDSDSGDTVTLSSPTSPTVGAFSAASASNPGTATYTFTSSLFHAGMSYNFTVRATDSNGNTSNSDLSISINVRPSQVAENLSESKIKEQNQVLSGITTLINGVSVPAININNEIIPLNTPIVRPNGDVFIYSQTSQTIFVKNMSTTFELPKVNQPLPSPTPTPLPTPLQNQDTSENSLTTEQEILPPTEEQKDTKPEEITIKPGDPIDISILTPKPTIGSDTTSPTTFPSPTPSLSPTPEPIISNTPQITSIKVIRKEGLIKLIINGANFSSLQNYMTKVLLFPEDVFKPIDIKIIEGGNVISATYKIIDVKLIPPNATLSILTQYGQVFSTVNIQNFK